MSKTTKLWINDKLELRWNEWPEVPPVKASIYADTLAMQAYEKALAKAKAESICLEEEDRLRIVVKLDITRELANSFIDWVGGVEVVWQFGGLGEMWQDGTHEHCLSMANKGFTIRQVARLKPVDTSELTVQAYSPTVTSEGEHYVARGIKDQILKAFNHAWHNDGSRYPDPEVTLQIVLDELKIK